MKMRRIRVSDMATEIIESKDDIPINLEKVVIKVPPKINLNLVDWGKNGLRIGVEIEGLGQDVFNEQPYSDKETAIKEYQHILEQINKGNYSIELLSRERLKLILTDSK